MACQQRCIRHPAAICGRLAVFHQAVGRLTGRPDDPDGIGGYVSDRDCADDGRNRLQGSIRHDRLTHGRRIGKAERDIPFLRNIPRESANRNAGDRIGAIGCGERRFSDACRVGYGYRRRGDGKPRP